MSDGSTSCMLPSFTATFVAGAATIIVLAIYLHDSIRARSRRLWPGQ